MLKLHSEVQYFAFDNDYSGKKVLSKGYHICTKVNKKYSQERDLKGGTISPKPRM